MGPSEPVLSSQEIGHIRAQLERSLLRIERSLQALARTGAREIDPSAVGRLSRIEALQNQGMTENIQERERLRFDEIVRALARLEAGTYGLCESCRDPIGVERLLVFPETRVCSGCGAD